MRRRDGHPEAQLPFLDRREAAQRLAEALLRYRGQWPLILAIPRGGAPLGRVLVDALGGDFDLVLVRKLGAPGDPELAIGAIDDTGAIHLNATAERVGADRAYIRHEAERQRALLERRRALYRSDRPAVDIAGRPTIVVDDGLATGATMIAALDAVRARRPQRLICAVPVAARDSLDEAARHADEVVCLATLEPFLSVGSYYRNFDPVEDEAVVRLLAGSEA
ncbi:MAG: phosphoribosyltransferase [Pseudomonadota bacterium]